MIALDTPAASAPSNIAPTLTERRAHPRHLLTRPVVAVAIDEAGLPRESQLREGFSIDVSRGGLSVELATNDATAERMVVGIEGDDGATRFATVAVRRSCDGAIGRRLGLQFIDDEQTIFTNANLWPTLDPRTYRLDTSLPAEALDAWAKLGVLEAEPLETVYVCPQCGSLPTFRHGCRSCGSDRVQSEQMIHHFACAHVGKATDFESATRHGDTLRCPKCRVTKLMVGTDFEYLPGPYCCDVCQWTDNEREQVGRCMNCDLRFAFDQAREVRLVGYHVKRMDVLALVGTS